MTLFTDVCLALMVSGSRFGPTMGSLHTLCTGPSVEDPRAAPYQADLVLPIVQEELSSERWVAEAAPRTVMKSVPPGGARYVAAIVTFILKAGSLAKVTQQDLVRFV